MESFRFEYPIVLLLLLPIIIFLILMRYWYYKPVRYAHSLVSYFSHYFSFSSWFFRFALFFARAVVFVVISFLIAKPQYVDMEDKVPIEGVDMVLALDMSGSMDFPDFQNKTRFLVAKEEAIRFVKKRVDDAIGLVVFGKYAISRCPLTFDKKMLEKIIADLEIGFVDPDGTMLARGLVAAVNRLKNSAAKSKIIILLTDGEPSDGDLDLSIALELANTFSIKVYTIGIGSDTEEVIFHPLYGPIRKPIVNKEILQHIAEKTGGKMFMAYNQTDMRLVYEIIDQLEKTKHDVPLFYHTRDMYIPFLFCSVIALSVELFLQTTFFFGL
jgi:Ca-activated chloride channel homolog